MFESKTESCRFFQKVKLTRVCLMAFATFLLSVGGLRADTVSFDLADGYSAAENSSTSQWSYRFGNDAAGRTGDYSLLATPPGLGQDTGSAIFSPLTQAMPAWNQDSVVALPWLGKNETGQTQGFRTVSWEPDEVIVHPNTGVFVVASWLSPISGIANFTYSFGDAESGDVGVDDGVNWYVDVNDQDLAGGSLSANTTTGQLVLAGVSLNAGDRLNFIVQSTGSLLTDTTRVSASGTVTSVPEPSGIFLIASGMTYVVCRRSKRD